MAVAKKMAAEELDSAELFALARLAAERGDLEGALLKLKQVISDADPSPESLALTARIYAQLRLFDRAENLYERFLEKQPNATVERFELGMARFDGGKAPQALETWEKLLKDQPNHPPAMFYRSLALAQAGKTGEARQTLDGLLKAIPTDNLYFGRGKELLQALESGRAADIQATKSTNGTDKLGTLPPGAYRTEH